MIRTSGPRSSRRGTIFSMPAIAMWTLGSDVVSRMLPSFSISRKEPVSATRKFAPLIPRSAVANRARSSFRAIAVSPAASSGMGRPRTRANRSRISRRRL